MKGAEVDAKITACGADAMFRAASTASVSASSSQPATARRPDGLPPRPENLSALLAAMRSIRNSGAYAPTAAM
jgi:hypothetical protein